MSVCRDEHGADHLALVLGGVRPGAVFGIEVLYFAEVGRAEIRCHPFVKRIDRRRQSCRPIYLLSMYPLIAWTERNHASAKKRGILVHLI